MFKIQNVLNLDIRYCFEFRYSNFEFMVIIGHQKQWGILKKLAEIGKLSHAYLFSGQEKLGKKKIAFEFLSCLFGKNLQGLAHPDFIFIEPLEGEIKISQIRELSWRLSLKNLSAPFKGAIIDNAHLMNFEAQNCLLKTLEEPKGKTILILATSQPNTLLPTVVSRCQTIKFYPVKSFEIENYLISKGVLRGKAEEITQICVGRPGLAFDLLFEPSKIEKHQKITSDFIKIFNSGLYFRFQYVKSISQKSKPVENDVSKGVDAAKEVLETWLWYLRKILLSKIQGKEDANFKNFSLVGLKNFLESLQKTIFLTSTKNINQRLALENLMLEL